MKLFSRGLFATWLALQSAVCVAQATAPGDSGKPFAATIDVQTAGALAYGDPIYLAVRITPLEPFDFEAITVSAEGQLASLYASAEADTREWTCAVSKGSHPVNIPFQVACEIRPNWSLAHYLSVPVLLLPSAEHKILLRIARQREGNQVEYFEETFVRIKPTKASVMVGGLLGALLLSLFVASYRRPGDPPTRTWDKLRADLATAPFLCGVSEIS
jgi:hypothetical protein